MRRIDSQQIRPSGHFRPAAFPATSADRDATRQTPSRGLAGWTVTVGWNDVWLSNTKSWNDEYLHIYIYLCVYITYIYIYSYMQIHVIYDFWSN